MNKQTTKNFNGFILAIITPVLTTRFLPALRLLFNAKPNTGLAILVMNIPRIELARLPTPLQPLDRLSEETGGPRIWIKRDDLTDTIASGNKLRKLEFTVARALSEGADLLITCGGIQSNHCRSTAMVAAKLGLKCHLILRGSPPAEADGNLLLDRILGAGISYVSSESYQDMDKCINDVASQYPELSAYFIPVGASDETGLWGYIECCAELKEDFARNNIEPQYIVSATGSGGTQGGLIIGSALYDLPSETIAFNVCDNEDYFRDKITTDFRLWEERYHTPVKTSNLSINVIDGYVGPGYAKATQPVFDTINRVAQLEGIVLDPVYTGKAFEAMLQEIHKGRFSGATDMVFIHTGGVYGNFPQRDQFGFQPDGNL